MSSSIDFSIELEMSFLTNALSRLSREVTICYVRRGDPYYYERVEELLHSLKKMSSDRVVVKNEIPEAIKSLANRFQSSPILSIETGYGNRLRFVGWMIGKLEKLVIEAVCISGESLVPYKLSESQREMLKRFGGEIDLYVLPGHACYRLGRMLIHLAYEVFSLNINIIDALEAGKELEKFEYDGFPVVILNNSKVVLNEVPDSIEELIESLAKQ